MIAVTFALKSESSSFLRLLRDRRSTGSAIISGRIEGVPVSVLHTGVGEKVTNERLSTFLGDESPKLLISSGFAGALTDTWTPGDLLLAENFSTPAAYAVAQTALNNQARCGTLTTVNQVIDAAAGRADVARDQETDAVDMETEFIAKACAAAGVPMVSLRAISDTPAAPFPAPPTVLFNVARQRTEFLRLFLYIAARPGCLGRFRKFARQIAMARANLAAALSVLLSDSELLKL